MPRIRSRASMTISLASMIFHPSVCYGEVLRTGAAHGKLPRQYGGAHEPYAVAVRSTPAGGNDVSERQGSGAPTLPIVETLGPTGRSLRVGLTRKGQPETL